MYYAIQSRDSGFIEWVTEADSPEAAFEDYDRDMGIDPDIDPYDESLDVLIERFVITEISQEEAEVLSQLPGDNPRAIEYLEVVRRPE